MTSFALFLLVNEKLRGVEHGEHELILGTIASMYFDLEKSIVLPVRVFINRNAYTNQNNW